MNEQTQQPITTLLTALADAIQTIHIEVSEGEETNT